MRIAAVIPAKGTSQRLDNKNLCQLDGRSLVRIACEKALESELITDVYLDTESERIAADVAPLSARGLQVLRRPPELASNEIGANELLIWAVHAIEECDLLIQLFVTNPLLRTATIDSCIRRFLETGEQHDSFFTVIAVQDHFWTSDHRPLNFDPAELPNTDQLEVLYQETHALFGISPRTLLRRKNRVGEQPLLIEIPKFEALDINNAEDLRMAEALAGHV